ncbi:MAG TPA: hypothetical protein VJ999_02650 [Candidatus Sulfotelmatobacter sp.]|nr:hypothetical protein [Candidatus Sulfotelmatobacter sp.]
MSTMAMARNRLGKKPAPLTYFLGFVFVLFIGILIFCYAITKRTNPVFLDQHGKPVAESAEHSH